MDDGLIRRRSDPDGWTFGLPALGVLLLPVCVGVSYAAAGALGYMGVGAVGEGASLERVRAVMTDPAVWEATAWSLWVSGASTLLALAGAVTVAVLFRESGRLPALARGLALVPLPVPHLAAAVGAVLVLGQSGFLARVGHSMGWVGVPADMPVLVRDSAGLGLILALTWKELPFLALVAGSVLATGGTHLEEAARDLGAAPAQVFRSVTWPTLWRGLLPATVAVFTFVAGSYETAALLGPTDPMPLPVLTWERYTDTALERRSDGYALALLGLILAALAVSAHAWVERRVNPGASR